MKPLQTDRAQLMARLVSVDEYDLAIIGGGATGLGTAVDAAVRGLKVVLVEAHDFAKGTSSRSTKLIHGGVRYLAQGHLPLVWEALHERQRLLRNAPHLAHAMPFVMPAYRRIDQWFYGLGLKLYDLLAGRAGLGPTQFLNRKETLHKAPGTLATHLVGGVQYWDGQFDDARLALALARTAAAHGALVINHMPVTGLLTALDSGKVCGLTCTDAETGLAHAIKARCVVNATGVWVDDIEAMTQTRVADTHQAHVPHAVSPSQGVHLVVDASFWPGESALLVPHTQDGRVLFAVPWQGKVLLGTTDTPKSTVEWEPQALDSEIDQILEEAGKYLAKPPTRHDVTSVWAGLRPLAGAPTDAGKTSSATHTISREHTVKMAPQGSDQRDGWQVDHLQGHGGRCDAVHPQGASLVPYGRRCHRAHPLWGAQTPAPKDPLAAYGTDAALLQEMPGHNHWLNPHVSEAMVRFAARYEYARTVEDVLARRKRLLFLDAKAAAQIAPEVASLLEAETGVDAQLAAFLALAETYQVRT